MFLEIVLLLVLFVAVVSDYRTGKIPNLLIINGIIIALLYHSYMGGLDSVWFAFKGFFIGIFILFIPFALGWMGAGDVKLLGVVGCFAGSDFVLNAFIWMAFWGAIIAAIHLAIEGRLIKAIMQIGRKVLLLFMGVRSSFIPSDTEANVCYPYGLAIALGVVTSYFKVWW